MGRLSDQAGELAQRLGDRAEAVAAHINDNWSAPMRAELLGAFAAPELKALVREAAPLILRARR